MEEPGADKEGPRQGKVGGKGREAEGSEAGDPGLYLKDVRTS